jgi:hypothetical protein
MLELNVVSSEAPDFTNLSAKGDFRQVLQKRIIIDTLFVLVDLSKHFCRCGYVTKRCIAAFVCPAKDALWARDAEVQTCYVEELAPD